MCRLPISVQLGCTAIIATLNTIIKDEDRADLVWGDSAARAVVDMSPWLCISCKFVSPDWPMPPSVRMKPQSILVIRGGYVLEKPPRTLN